MLGVYESQVSRDERNEHRFITVERVTRILEEQTRRRGLLSCGPLEAGRVGVWTKADSVTLFDDLSAAVL